MMIEAKQIIKNFGQVEVLKGIDLRINKGEVVSIVGASGAGKTTLLQIISTLDKPSSGEVYFEGQDIFSLNDKELAAFRNTTIGFIFQFHQLLPEFTSVENVLIPAMIAKTDLKKAAVRAKELLDFLNLSHRLEHKPAELSGGEKQRVAIARALINNPEVIFADEPTGNLDSQNRDEMHQLFIRLRNEFKQTFVIVSHDLELAKISDRVLTIKDGVMV